MVIFQENVLLKDFSNYKIGGPARYFCEPKNEDDLREAVREARQQGLSTFILGGATNLLISDKGFDGMVIKPEFKILSVERSTISASADILVSRILDEAAKHSLSGLEWAGGLPGTVGGAVRGNAGAFGGETKDSIVSVRSYDEEADSFVERENAECRFGYRMSVFKEKNGREIIVSARFMLSPGEEKEIRARGEQNASYRKKFHPLEYPNIGSTFKNVPLDYFCRMSGTSESEAKEKFFAKTDPFPVVPSAFLISEAGMKGVSHGGAQIAEKHPNFIINHGAATAADVEFLITAAKRAVREKFGVELEEEIQRVGMML